MDVFPANAQRISEQEAEFIALATTIQAGSAYRYDLLHLFKLQNAAQVASFESLHKRVKIMKMYSNIDDSTLQAHFENGFSCFPIQSYAVFTSTPISHYALECEVALYQPFTTDNKRFCETPPPGGFDCYCLVPSGFVQMQGGDLALKDSELERQPPQYYLWQRNNLIPTRFLELQPLNKPTLARTCDICTHCVRNKMHQATYFGDERLRDHYVDGSGNPASVYCMQDQAYLCATCDRNLHKTAIQQAHLRQQLPQYQATMCVQHGQIYQYMDQATGRFYCKACNRSHDSIEIAESLIKSPVDPLPYHENMEILKQSIAKLQQLTSETEQSFVKNFQANLKHLQKYSQFGVQQILAQMIELSRMHGEYSALSSAVRNKSLPLDRRLSAQYAFDRVTQLNESQYQIIAELLSNFLGGQAAIFQNALEAMNFRLQLTNSELKQIGGKQNDLRILGLLAKIEFQKEFNMGELVQNANNQVSPILDGGIFKNTRQPLKEDYTGRVQEITNEATNLIQLQQAQFENPQLTQNPRLYKTIGAKQADLMPVKPKNRRKHKEAAENGATGKNRFEEELERLREEQRPKTQVECLTRMVDEAELDFEAQQQRPADILQSDANLMQKLDIGQSMRLQKTGSSRNPLNYINFEPIDPAQQILESKVFAYNDKTYSFQVPELKYDEKLAQLSKMYKVQLTDQQQLSGQTGTLTQNQIFERLSAIPFQVLSDDQQRCQLFFFVAHFMRLTHGWPKLRFQLPNEQKCTSIKQFFAVSENKSAVLIINALDEMCVVFIPKVIRLAGIQKYSFVLFLSQRTYQTDVMVRMQANALQVGDVLLSERLTDAVIRGVQRKILSVEISIYGSV